MVKSNWWQRVAQHLKAGHGKTAPGSGWPSMPGSGGHSRLGGAFSLEHTTFQEFSAHRLDKLSTKAGSGLASANASDLVQAARERYIQRSQNSEHALVYVSRATSSEQPHSQLRNMRQDGVSEHMEQGIHSALVLQDGMFCQWLQGQPDALDAMYRKVRADPRHSAAMTLYRGPASASMLDSWCMGTRSLYMGQGDAFKRSQRLRLVAKDHAFASPFAAWMAFAGLQHLAKDSGEAPSTFPMGESKDQQGGICLLGNRSALGGQMLLDATKTLQTKLVVSRWGGPLDLNADLQTVEALLPSGQASVQVTSISARSLRAGVVREKLRRAQHWVFVLSDDDPAELTHLLTSVERNTPPGLPAPRVTVLAPQWRKDTQDHAAHMLQVHQLPGSIHGLNLAERGVWQRFVGLAGR